MDKMAGNKDNVANLEMDEKILEEWKTAYKNCKKQRSIMVKDPYDEFISDIKSKYKSDLKDELKMSRNSIDFEKFKGFFVYVAGKSKNYLEKTAKSDEASGFYRNKRKTAVENLIKVSQNVVKKLDEIKSKGVTTNGDDKDFLEEECKVKIGNPVKVSNKLDGYMFSYVTDKYGFRLYVVLTLNRFVKGTFDFIHYEFNGNENYEDKNVKSRNIYLIAEKNVDLDVPLIDKTSLKVSAFVSPNNFFTDGLGGLLINTKCINVEGKALTKVVVD